MTKSLSDNDMLTTRRTALRSFAAKTGLAAALIAGAVIGSTGTASASDRRNQTDNDTGRNSDDVSQTDHD